MGVGSGDGLTMILFAKKDIAKILSMRYRLSRVLGPGKRGWFDNEPICKELFVNGFVEVYCDD